MSRKRKHSAPRRQPDASTRPTEPVNNDLDQQSDGDVLAPALKEPAVWAGAGLVAVTLLVFVSLRFAGFVELDDPGYVRDNPHINHGFTWPGLAWAWSFTGYAANWHPLTWMSHMLDVELFGLRAGGHHLVSLALHVANVLLLFVLLKRTTGALLASTIVAGLFAVHPLHVESVAWIAERKDVLSTLFWLLAMLAYVSYVQTPGWWRYGRVFALMALGLMAKPMLVTLPLALLLFDIWPLERVKQGRRLSSLIVEKLPLLGLSVASGIITLIVQREGGAISGLSLLPLSTRMANAIVSYARYLVKMVWPTDLAIFYPYQNTATNPLPTSWVIGSIVLLIALSIVALLAVRRRPYIFFGWAWYVVTLIPVIGIVQVGTQSIADRYTYVPLIGIFAAIVWWIASLTEARRALRWTAAGLGAAAVFGCAVIAHAQANVWHSNWTVWSHALAVTSHNYMAENEVGVELVKQGKNDEALPHFEASVRERPEFVEARSNLGLAYTRIGRLDEAIENLQVSARLKPDKAQTFHDLGFAYLGKGRIQEAIANYETALRLKPDYPDAHNSLGFVLAANGRVPEAIAHFQEAVRLAPNATTGHMYLAMAYGAAGRLTDAVQEFKEVLRIDPTEQYAQSQMDLLLAEIKRRGGGK